MAHSKHVPPTPKASAGAAANLSRQPNHLQDGDISFRLLFMNNPQPMWVFDLKTLQFLEVNGAAVEHYGYSRDEFLRLRITDIRPQEDVPALLESIAQADSELQHSGNWRHLLKDGRLIDVEIVSHTLMFAGREAELVVVRDITQQKQAAEDLKQAEQKYRLIFEEAMIGIFQSTPDGRLLSVNPAMARMCGYDSPEEMMELIHNVQQQMYVDSTRRNEFKRLLHNEGMVEHFEIQVYRKNGSTMWLSVNARAVCDGNVTLRYEGTFENINERKMLEGLLQQAEQKYRGIVEDAIVGIFQSTPDGRYLTVNPAMATMLGYESPDDLMASITDIPGQLYVDPEDRQGFLRVMDENGIVQNYEMQAYRKDGSKMWISASARAIRENGVVVRYEGMNEDITERRLLGDQLRQAQKMEAVGRLAGGVAHDFNNALAVITGYSDLLKASLPEDGPQHKQADEIAKAGRRAAVLTRQLLAFSRKQVIQPVVLDLNAVIGELEKMLCRLIGEDVEITFKRHPGLGRVKVDPGQVEQVLMNLAINSRDAMPQGGKVCIETANVELDEIYARQNVYVTPGCYVMLSVSDTGCGMDKEIQAHIFEPFFTTKEIGKGTGLGLSTVYGIVKQNGGYIRVYSEVGMGTTFKLYFPRAAHAAELAAPVRPQDVIVRGTETVLLVEDEEPLRVLARTCLEGHGYLVLDAHDATQALELAANHHGPIHLLLTDVIMPGMSGHDLAHRLVADQPGMKVLYMSGYTSDLIDQYGILNQDTVLLEKPFTLHSLLSKVHQTLHAAPGSKSASAS